ncbi:hypothetical protein Apa02nite_006400 [Actinoplanes palleronii]|uniref:Uncharacterized protein n=1 Tax=Actinoplanes palleronii TaxID=113570 RepID=A0ABQ4B1J3_9ACTN|nr:hypothetical protein Apa02nite_006400 [Actinoplanes palleronii]
MERASPITGVFAGTMSLAQVELPDNAIYEEIPNVEVGTFGPGRGGSTG